MSDNPDDDTDTLTGDASADTTERLTSTPITSNYKVRGKKPASSGTGVLGHNTATSGTAFGVEGVTDSATDGAAGVRGVGTATSGGIYGVLGLTDSPSGMGLVGAASDTAPLISLRGAPAGVWGHTDKSGVDANVDFGTGVFGEAAASSGEAYGVTGSTNSADGYAVFALGDSKTDGNHEVTGTLVGSGLVGTANIASEVVTNSKIDSGTTIDRGKLDTDMITTRIDSNVTASYSTSGEETVFVDTSNQSVTITLSDSDGVAGRTIRVVDETGDASTNTISIQAGGSFSLAGPNSSTISSPFGYREYQFFDAVWHEVSSN